MEVGNVPHIGPQKAGNPREAMKARGSAVNAYAKVERKEEGDVVAVSSQARLLHNLRSKYDDLPSASKEVQELKDKIKDGDQLSAEDIVSGILMGTLFEAL